MVLFLFGLTRGGIDLAAFAPTTLYGAGGGLDWASPLGLSAGAASLAARLSARCRCRAVWRRAIWWLIARSFWAMGFTVPVLALETALPGGAMQEAARLGLARQLLAGLCRCLRSHGGGCGNCRDTACLHALSPEYAT